ncbi:MAG TPA: type II secretion system F family protein, partial [Vicinamibacterales bacterium]|nr:type II secretion system F family protein [Vicinamibacterales bacterium]
MALAFLAFVLVAGTVIGGYLAMTSLPDMFANRRMSQRLLDVSAAPDSASPAEDADLVKSASEGPMPEVDRMIVRTAAGSRLTQLIQGSGVRVSPSVVMFASVGLGVILAMAAGLVARQAWAPLLAAPLGVALPFMWLANRRTARLRRFEEQFPEALDLMSRAIRAGHAFQTAMGMAASELPEPVGPEFKTTFDQQNFGLPLKDALHQMTERVPILDVRFFVTAVLIQRETGGNLSEILDNLAHVVRE